MELNISLNESTLRKLSPGELVYDYELKLKGCILPFTVLFSSTRDLFENKPVLDKSIQEWKKLHPFLRSTIVKLEDSDHKNFSHERYFANLNEVHSTKLDNVSYLKLERNNDQNNYWKLFHERELNSEPIGGAGDAYFLWRINFIQLSHSLDKFEYCLTFTVHHSITDGRNSYAILNQLLEIMEEHILNRYDESKYEKFKVNSSLDEMLLSSQGPDVSAIKFKSRFEHSPNDKIPAQFQNTFANVSKTECESNHERFVYLFEKENLAPILISDLLNSREENKYISKFSSFTFEKQTVNQMLLGCRKVNAKLTGLLNFICSLATHQLYNAYHCQELGQVICFHFMANLRAFLNVGNTNMGYFPVVLNGIFEAEEAKHIYDSEGNINKDKFWNLAKRESDLIHERINSSEMYEASKLDEILLKLIDQNYEFENGNVHFALSNLGALTSSSSLLHVKEFYYNTSSVSKRWTAVVFHGLSTINNTLCWSIGYNSSLISDDVIQKLAENIKQIIEIIIKTN